MFLLPVDTLLGAIQEGDPIKAWVDAQPPTQLWLSVVAIGMAQIAIETQLTGSERELWLRKLNDWLARLKLFAGEPLIIDSAIVDRWVKLQQDTLEVEGGSGRLEPLDVDARLVIATAAQHGLTLVEPKKAYHAQLQRLGIQVHSL